MPVAEPDGCIHRDRAIAGITGDVTTACARPSRQAVPCRTDPAAVLLEQSHPIVTWKATDTVPGVFASLTMQRWLPTVVDADLSRCVSWRITSQ